MSQNKYAIYFVTVLYCSSVSSRTWVVIAVLMNMIGQGMLLSYTSCLLPALNEPQSPIKADLHTASLLASVCGLAGVPGFFISSILMDIYGRRWSHLIVIIPGVVGWLAVYLAQNIPVLMLGRILGGISAGATVALGAIVIGEYSDPKYRGVFLNLKTASVNFGSMLVHILGNFFTWRTVALIGIFPLVTSILITYTWPESPPWLASKGKFDESKKSFHWLRKNNESSEKELEELIKAQMTKFMKPKMKRSISDTLKQFLIKFTRKDFLKPLFIMILSCVLLEASGRHIFPAYGLQIISEVSGTNSHFFYYTLGIDIIITTSAVCSSFLVKIMKRRTLLFSTGFAACFVLIITCTYFALVANNIIAKDLSSIGVGFFALFFILANLGCTPIPMALLGEVFPLAHREVGSAVVGTFMSLCVMIGLQITPYLLISLKVFGTFFVFAIILGVMLLLLYFVLPETKDKTLQEIENYFNTGKYKDYDDDEEVKLNIMK